MARDVIYEDAKDTARKIRKALKKRFPELPARHFSVRSDVYSGGSSISVSWEDYPNEGDVSKIINKYQSASFDGMIDLETVHGYVDPEDGLTYSGAKYIFAKRNVSNERQEKVLDYLESKYEDFNRDHWYSHDWTRKYNDALDYFDINNEMLPEYDEEAYNESKKGYKDIEGILSDEFNNIIENGVPIKELGMFTNLALSAVGDIENKNGEEYFFLKDTNISTNFLRNIKSADSKERLDFMIKYSNNQKEYEEGKKGIVQIVLQDSMGLNPPEPELNPYHKLADKYQKEQAKRFRALLDSVGNRYSQESKDYIKSNFIDLTTEEVKELIHDMELNMESNNLYEEFDRHFNEKVGRVKQELDIKEQNEDTSEPKYNESQMKMLASTDGYIGYVVKDLKKRGHSESQALELAFNSNVLEDSAMAQQYSELQITLTEGEKQEIKEHMRKVAKDNDISPKTVAKAVTMKKAKEMKLENSTGFMSEVKGIITEYGESRKTSKKAPNVRELFEQGLGLTRKVDIEDARKYIKEQGMKFKLDAKDIEDEVALMSMEFPKTNQQMETLKESIYNTANGMSPVGRGGAIKRCIEIAEEYDVNMSKLMDEVGIDKMKFPKTEQGMNNLSVIISNAAQTMRDDEKDEERSKKEQPKENKANVQGFTNAEKVEKEYENRSALAEYVMERLIQGEVKLLFTKANGSERFMQATRNPSLVKDNDLKAQIEEINTSNNKGKEIAKGKVNVVDTEIDSGRSFVIDRLIALQVGEGNIEYVTYKEEEDTGEHFNPRTLSTLSLINILKDNVVRLVFTKKDGTLRPMVATRNAELVDLYLNNLKSGKRPKNTLKEESEEKIEKQIKGDYVTVLDLEEGAFKTFKPSTLEYYDSSTGIASWIEFAPNNDAWYAIAKNGQSPKQYYKEGKRKGINIGRTLPERTKYEQQRKLDNIDQENMSKDMDKALENAKTRREEEKLKAERRTKLIRFTRDTAIKYAKENSFTKLDTAIYNEYRKLPKRLEKSKAFNNMENTITQVKNWDEERLTAIQVGSDVFYLHPTFIVNVYSGRVYMDKTQDKAFSNIGKVFGSDADTGSEDEIEKIIRKIGRRNTKSDIYRTDEKTNLRVKRVLYLANKKGKELKAKGISLGVDKVAGGKVDVLVAKMNDKIYYIHPDAIHVKEGNKLAEVFRCKRPTSRLTELSTFFGELYREAEQKENKERVKHLGNLVIEGNDLRKKIDVA